MAGSIFDDEAERWWEAGYSIVPIQPGTKRPAKDLRGWQGYANEVPGEKIRSEWLKRYAGYGVGLLLGKEVKPGFRIAAVDVDDDGLVGPVREVLGRCPCIKRGKKGETIFVFVPSDLKSSRINSKHGGGIDILINGKMTVLPPTIHPDTNKPYVWLTKSLLELSLEELPLLSSEKLRLINLIVRSEHAWTLIGGVGTHDAGVSLTASLVGIGCDDGQTEAIITSLLPKDYAGDSLLEIPGWIESARKKGFGTGGRRGASQSDAGERAGASYEPGEVGPKPLGVFGAGYYFRTVEGAIIKKSPGQLTSHAELFDMAPKRFWEEAFPKVNKEGIPFGIDNQWAGDALMQACRRAGRVDPSRIRGAGVWAEGDEIVANLGPDPIDGKRFIYAIPSKPIELRPGQVALERVHSVLSLFNWVHPGAPQLLIGWAVLAVICGVLDWRPHIGLTGPRASGKTTVIKLLRRLIGDMALYFEGTSTEAGIRQDLGADARGIIVDELEMEGSGDQPRIERIIKFIRSVSSSEGKVVRGTVDGRPLTFSVNSTFLVAAINLYRVSAADTSRMIRLELSPPERKQLGARDQIEQLLNDLKEAGPAFCQLAIDHVQECRASIPILHRALNTETPREADNLAPLLAGYFVAKHRRPITDDEARVLAHEHADLVRAQREENELDDDTECLNALLGHDFVLEGQGEEGRDRRTLPLGHIVGIILAHGDSSDADQIARVGIRKDGDGFLIANNHPGLTRIFRGTRWEGGLWSSALSRLGGAEKRGVRRFGPGVRTRAVWIPVHYFEDFDEPTSDAVQA